MNRVSRRRLDAMPGDHQHCREHVHAHIEHMHAMTCVRSDRSPVEVRRRLTKEPELLALDERAGIMNEGTPNGT